MKLNHLTKFLCAVFMLSLVSCKKDGEPPHDDSICKITALDLRGQLGFFKYDENSRIAEVQEYINHTLTYEPDRILISNGSYTEHYKLNADGLVTESVLYEDDGGSYTGAYTYEDGYLTQITYDGEPVYRATITFEYENGNISNIIHTDEFTEGPSELAVEYQPEMEYVPYSLWATDALVFWARELLLYEQGYMGKIIQNRIQSTDVDELVYTADEKGNITNIENIATGKTSDYINYRYECD